MSMNVPPPTPARIGPYVVSSILGQGGMGVVYLARDTRLNREVAIKMLPPGIVEAGQRSRFQREARLLASLNHPNIATIFGLEEQEGSHYLVLERLRGETLASRLSRGPMAPEEAFRAGIQIAMALEAAHDGNVVHRDLKPGNVMITPRGHVKVLDFGLARHSAAVPGEPAGITVTDLESGLTSAGHVTGTPGYMSPEQVQAGVQGSFTDLFAFGCVLYECLTGVRAFPGGVMESLLGVLSGEPDWTRLPDIPAAVRDLLRGCLEKDPDLRLAEAATARIVLEQALGQAPAEADRRGEAGRKEHNLPRRLTSFIGREEALGEVHDRLREGRLVTLTGPGGSGKTRLAVEIADREFDAFPDGIRFVDLTPISDPARIPEAFTVAFGLRNETGALVEFLGPKALLIVLDNCEHVLREASRCLSELLAGCPGLKVVATSREPLGVPGEQVLPVPAFFVPDSCDRLNAAEIAKLDAVRLFVDRARLAASEFELDLATARVVSDICRRLDGLPLAIELAATRVKLLSVEQIRDRLNDRFRLLTDRTSSGSDRHRTLEATIDWSYDHLEEDEKALFRRLAVFSGGWSLEAAIRIDASARDEYETLDCLARLVDKSLVVVDRPKGGEPRYRFLESVHQYARRKLADSSEAGGTRDRHLDFFLDLARTADLHRAGSDQVLWLRRIEIESANFLAAVEWAAAHPALAPRAIDLAVSAWRTWYDLGQSGIGRRIIGLALEANTGAKPDLSRARALEGAALMALEQGDIEVSRRHYEESLSIAEALGERSQMANALNGLGAVVSDGLGDYAESRPYFDRCLAIYRELGDQGGIAKGLNNLGRVSQHEGNPVEARRLFEESLSVRRAMGSGPGIAKSLGNLVILATKLGDLDAARVHLAESLEQAQRLHMMSLGASLLEAAARLLLAAEASAAAGRQFGAAAALRLQIQVPLLPEEQGETETYLRELERRIGPKLLEEHIAAGRRLTFPEAVQEVVSWCRRDESQA